MCLTLNVDLGKITLWVIMSSMPKLTELLLRCGSKSQFRLFTLHEALFNTLFLLRLPLVKVVLKILIKIKHSLGLSKL